MAETAKSVAARLSFSPHPFEGWFKEIAHQPKMSRTVQILLDGQTHVPWHKLPAEITWRFIDGAPMAISTSLDDVRSEAVHLSATGQKMTIIPRNSSMTLASMGAWSIIEGTFSPDIPVSQRIHYRENWAPGKGAP